MILGIGTDIANIERIKNILAKHDQRFMDRCFTDAEQARGSAKNSDEARIAHFAKLWAAKEAFAKALGTGFRDGIYLKDIEVLNDELGKPFIEVYGGTLEELDKKTPSGHSVYIHTSISDDAPAAVAFVIIELEKENQ